jgi:hypothetical protein
VIIVEKGTARGGRKRRTETKSWQLSIFQRGVKGVEKGLFQACLACKIVALAIATG